MAYAKEIQRSFLSQGAWLAELSFYFDLIFRSSTLDFLKLSQMNM